MKTLTTIRIETETLKKAQEYGINISKFCEYALSKAINQLEHLQFQNNQGSIGTKGSDKCGRRDLNPGRRRGRSMPTLTDVDWDAFRDWLLRDRKRHTVVSMVSYAQKYADCLFERDLSRVRDLPLGVRPHVLKSLSALSKFLGVYEEYKMLIKRYGLKWGGKSTDDIIIDRLTKIEDPDEIFNWIRQVKKLRPELNDFMDLIAVSGMRLVEAVTSYNLIIELSKKGKLNRYYNEEKRTLEHFKFKKLFIRKNKKVFVSFVPKKLVTKISLNEKVGSSDTIINKIEKQGLKSRFGDVREAHASFMIKYLKQPEIDFLHGRISANVFMKHYFNPALIHDLKKRVFKGIAEIQKKI